MSLRSYRRAVFGLPIMLVLSCVMSACSSSSSLSSRFLSTSGAAVQPGAPAHLALAVDGVWPTLREGPNSSWPPATVRSAQYLLNAHGAHLAVDGVFGPLTEAAVLSFQATHGLVVDGIIGSQTWSALIITVSRSSTGSAVKAAQDQINFRNLRGTVLLAVDGIFGPLTQASVVSFQRGVGLVPDGIVGPLTWRALISEFMSG